MARLSVPSLMVAQSALALAALCTASFWPPREGRLLLVPLAGGDPGRTAALAVAGGALLLGQGPLPGSMVVVGERARVARYLPGWSVAMIAAPPAGCGIDPAGAARA